MASNKLVLVLTQDVDSAADAVIRKLNERGVNVFRFHTHDFPQYSTLSAKIFQEQWDGTIAYHNRLMHFDQVTSVLYRRPRRFEIDPDLSPSENRFATAEAVMAVGGLLRSMNCLWVNHPEKLITSNYKPLQLKIARSLGLEIPRTLITNEPEAVKAFFKECEGHMIYKPLSYGAILSEENELSSIYTSRVSYENLKDADRVRQTPCLFQEYVHKRLELRINVIGNRVFAAEIYSQNSERSATDWRKSYDDLSYGIHQLPKEIEDKCLALVRQLDLQFGAIDMVLTPDDRYVFLEVNPGGQWDWIEARTGLPLASAFADLLTQESAVE
jgi:ATP-grasp ribosomal peptide maturase